MKIIEINKEEFNKFTKYNESEHSFLQTIHMFEVFQKNNNSESKLLALVNDSKEVLAVCVALIKKVFGGKRMDIHGGVRLSQDKYFEDFFNAIKVYSKENNIIQLVVKLNDTVQSYDLNGEPTTDRNVEIYKKMESLGFIYENEKIGKLYGMPDWHYLKDLTGFLKNDEDSKLLKSFNQNSKRKIKKAIELGIVIRECKIDELKAFKDVTNETAQRQGFNDKSLEYYEGFYKEFGKQKEFLIAELNLDDTIVRLENEINTLMEHQKKNSDRINSLTKQLEEIKEIRSKVDTSILMLANAIMVYTPYEGIYFIGGSKTEYQSLSGAFLLQYEAMKHTLDRDLKLYNFFGIEGVFDGSDGVLRFKQNFNGFINEKVGAFVYYPNPTKTKIINGIKKILRRQ